MGVLRGWAAGQCGRAVCAREGGAAQVKAAVQRRRAKLCKGLTRAVFDKCDP